MEEVGRLVIVMESDSCDPTPRCDPGFLHTDTPSSLALPSSAHPSGFLLYKPLLPPPLHLPLPLLPGPTGSAAGAGRNLHPGTESY